MPQDIQNVKLHVAPYNSQYPTIFGVLSYICYTRYIRRISTLPHFPL